MQFALTLVRHGETEWNKNHLIQTFSDEPLNATGTEQSLLLGKHLKDEKFTKIYVSDLSRTHQTAHGILGSKDPSAKTHFVKDARLTEKSYGAELEGTCAKEFLAKAMASSNPFTYSTPEGETYESIRNRCASFFQELCKELKENPSLVEENVLVVTHGVWMAHLLHYFDKEPNCTFVDVQEEAVTAKDYTRWISNTGVIKLEVAQLSDSKCKVKMFVFNDTTHLNPS